MVSRTVRGSSQRSPSQLVTPSRERGPSGTARTLARLDVGGRRALRREVRVAEEADGEPQLRRADAPGALERDAGGERAVGPQARTEAEQGRRPTLDLDRDQ